MYSVPACIEIRCFLKILLKILKFLPTNSIIIYANVPTNNFLGWPTSGRSQTMVQQKFASISNCHLSWHLSSIYFVLMETVSLPVIRVTNRFRQFRKVTGDSVFYAHFCSQLLKTLENIVDYFGITSCFLVTQKVTYNYHERHDSAIMQFNEYIKIFSVISFVISYSTNNF